MEEKTVSAIRRQIGDTIYIIENTISESAKETAYDKVKRLILNDAEIYQKKPA